MRCEFRETHDSRLTTHDRWRYQGRRAWLIDRIPGSMIGSSNDPFRQQHKIVSVSQLPAIRQQFRDKTIVLCHGAFDLVHMGHLLHFEEARSLGDMLVVTITADRHITKKRSVSFSEEYRARQLAALEIVDAVAVIDEPSAVTAIEALHPDLHV